MKNKVFLVTQDLKLVDEIVPILKNEGFEVHTTASPEMVSEQCKKENFDLVLLDVHLRKVPYEKLIPEIKNASPETEVVVMTSYAFPESMAKDDISDIAGYLIKPFSRDKVKKVITRALKQGELIRENKRLLLNITAAKKEWEATVDAIDSPIFVTDFDYNILRANLTTFQTLGKGVKDVVGHKCYKVFHCADYPLDDCPGKRAMDRGEPVHDVISFKGLKKRLNCSVYPQVFAEGGGLVHYLHEPDVKPEFQAEMMTKYERLFLDAALPILLIDLENYKVVDANQRAIELFGYNPENISDRDLEELFPQKERESVMSWMIKEAEGNSGVIKTKILTDGDKEIAVYMFANPVEIGSQRFLETFIILEDSLKSD